MDNTTIKVKVNYDEHIKNKNRFMSEIGLGFNIEKGEVITVTDASIEIKLRCDHYDKDTGKFEGTVIE